MMSIIIQNELTKEIILYSKGADSIMLPLLKAKNSQTVNETKDYLTEYANIGLRTLILGKRKISFDEYKIWKQRYEVSYFFLIYNIFK